MLELLASSNDLSLMLLTLKINLKFNKSHTPSTETQWLQFISKRTVATTKKSFERLPKAQLFYQQ
jgi:hypothetical protein